MRRTRHLIPLARRRSGSGSLITSSLSMSVPAQVHNTKCSTWHATVKGTTISHSRITAQTVGTLVSFCPIPYARSQLTCNAVLLVSATRKWDYFLAGCRVDSERRDPGHGGKRFLEECLVERKNPDSAELLCQPNGSVPEHSKQDVVGPTHLERAALLSCYQGGKNPASATTSLIATACPYNLVPVI